jgi:hypothetical protein
MLNACIYSIEKDLENWVRWEAEYTHKLSLCDGQRERWERSRNFAEEMKQKLLQRMKEEEHAVLSLMFPGLCWL